MADIHDMLGDVRARLRELEWTVGAIPAVIEARAKAAKVKADAEAKAVEEARAKAEAEAKVVDSVKAAEAKSKQVADSDKKAPSHPVAEPVLSDQTVRQSGAPWSD
jgi:membrane protein involved in colicin uptake